MFSGSTCQCIWIFSQLRRKFLEENSKHEDASEELSGRRAVVPPIATRMFLPPSDSWAQRCPLMRHVGDSIIFFYGYEHDLVWGMFRFEVLFVSHVAGQIQHMMS